MSKKELKQKEKEYNIYGNWKQYKFVCLENLPKKINESALDILNSNHPYEELVYQSDLERLNITYNEFQSLMIKYKNQNPTAKPYTIKRGIIEKKIEVGPVNIITPIVDVTNESSEYKAYKRKIKKEEEERLQNLRKDEKNPQENSHQKCLKAADYKGCMNYQNR